MKKFLILLLSIMLFGLTSYAQKDTTHSNVEYPAYYIIDKDTIGIIITIEQAQALDNDIELLDLFEKMKISCDSTIKRYVIVVNEYENQIGILKTTVASLKTVNSEQTSQIKTLKDKCKNYELDIQAADLQVKKQKRIISNKDKEITGLKIKNKLVGIGGGVLGIAAGIVIGLFVIH